MLPSPSMPIQPTRRLPATRRADWPQLLDDYIRACEHTPFHWAGHNCASFAAHWVQIATGQPVVLPAIGSARRAIEMLADLRPMGGLATATTIALERQPVVGLYAAVGDVVLLRVPRTHRRTASALGICLGAQVAATGLAGIVMVPITEAEAAWRV